MNTLLIKNVAILATMNADRAEIPNAFVSIRDGMIDDLGPMTRLERDRIEDYDKVIDAKACIVTPGLVNTHHHLYQTLTRAVPGAQNALLFGWLQRLYPIWAQMTSQDMYLSAKLGLAELIRSGCTLSSDHLYLYPNDVTLGDTIRAASELGIRFHATRGSMSIGESEGGLPPDSLVEDEAFILRDTTDLIDRYHDASHGAMVRVGVAPCSPFSVSRELMRDSAMLARDKGVMMHTHLAENEEDIAYSLEKFGCRPGQYAQDLGWTGEDVWHAHCVKLDPGEIELFARSGTGVAHCPHSNCRLGSGIAPLGAMIDAGVKLGLGVDGSASNDIAHLLLEARMAMLLQRVENGADALDPRKALEIATKGGASVLGRDDCGSLEIGKCGDLVLWDINSLAFSGGWDPVAALVLNGPHEARDVIINGKVVLQGGVLLGCEERKMIAEAQVATERLVNL